MNYKIMTYNLRFDNVEDGDNQWAYRVDKVVKMIKSYEPIIFGTQEGLLSMLNELDESLTNYQWIGKSRRGNSEDEFSAIFYDLNVLECLDQGQFWLSEEPFTPNSISWNSSLPRICTWGYFKNKKNPTEKFIFYNTHLDHESAEARNKGAFLIWEHIKEKLDKENTSIILTGDFNSEPDSQEIQFLSGQIKVQGEYSCLRNVFSILPNPPRATFHDFDGGDAGEVIDYIFVSPNIQIKDTIIDRSTIDGIFPSDHYPVISTINFK